VVNVDFCDKKIIRRAIKQKVWPLTPAHWEVISFVRDYHRKTGQAAIAVRIGRATGLSCRQLHDLFPLGVIRTVFPLLELPLPVDL